MTRSLLLLLFMLPLHSLVNAQTAQPPDTTAKKPKIEASQRAAKQLKRLEKQLHLTQDQVLQLQVILINRDIAMDSIRQSSTGDRRADNRARRQIQQDADSKITGLLTDEQKPLYQSHKSPTFRATNITPTPQAIPK